jgi:hypothetical protein
MRPGLCKGAGGALVLLLAAGCGSRLHDERTVSVEPGVEKTLTIDAPSRDQKVSVKVSASGGPVDVYCYLVKDQAEAEKAIRRHKASDKILDKAEKAEQASLEFTVPANSGALILLQSASSKAASAKVTIDGR